MFNLSMPQKWAVTAALILLAALYSGSALAENRPWPEGEKLNLEIFWPSGVTLGDATLQAKSIKDTLYFSATVEIALPEGRILYKYSSTATSDLCSKEFRQSVQKSGKTWEEVTTFNSESGNATISRDGRSREVASPKCARDPLTYLYYYRAQAASGKKPGSDTLFLAGPLALRIEAQAKGPIKINRTERQGSRYKVTYPSALGEGAFELWLADSPAQTPIAVRLPLALATFTAELREQ